MLQAATPISYAGYYDQQICWKQSIHQYRLLYNLTLPSNYSIYLKSYINTHHSSTNEIISYYLLKNGYKYPISNNVIVDTNLISYSMKHPMYDDLPFGE